MTTLITPADLARWANARTVADADRGVTTSAQTVADLLEGRGVGAAVDDVDTVTCRYPGHVTVLHRTPAGVWCDSDGRDAGGRLLVGSAMYGRWTR